MVISHVAIKMVIQLVTATARPLCLFRRASSHQGIISHIIGDRGAHTDEGMAADVVSVASGGQIPLQRMSV